MTTVNVGADDVGPGIDRLVEHDHLLEREKIAARDAWRADLDRLADHHLDGV